MKKKILVAIVLTIALCFVSLIIYMGKTIQQQKITIAKQHEVICRQDGAIKEFEKKQESKQKEAKTEKEYLIDIIEQECLKNSKTTSNMLQCVTNATEAWFKEIDKYMGLLKKELPKEKYQTLETSQKKWKNYQVVEFKTIGEAIYLMQGTMYIPVGTDKQCEIVRQRALALTDYYQDITQSKSTK